MKERTEEQKISQSPFAVVTLGGEEYPIKPLPYKKSREWKQKVVNLMSSMPKYARTTTDTPEDFEASLNALLITSSDTIVDLFFEYAQDLDRDKIEEVATDTELAEAFKKVMEFGFFPLAQSLNQAFMKMAQ